MSLKNSFTLYFLVFFIAGIISSRISTAQNYHFKEGFNLEVGGNNVPDGWSTDYTYPSKTYNHGFYYGPRCIKFTKGYSFIITPEYLNAGTLNFWLLLDPSNNDGKEKFYIEISKNGGSFELIDSLKAENNELNTEWSEHSIEINETSNQVKIRFSVCYTDPEGSSPKSLIYLDDISLTDLSFCEGSETPDTKNYPNRFYVNAINGDDQNSGKSESEAWKTLNKVSSETYSPGDTILLKCGCLWNEILEPQGSGDSDAPIVITSYGEGNKPVIDAQGSISSGYQYSASIRLYNQEYWKIEKLSVQNYAASESLDTKQKYGILIEGKNSGTLRGFHLTDLEVCNVNGIIDERKNGGLGFIISRSSSGETVSNFDGIEVENCYFHDLGNCGLFTDSDWSNRDLTSKFGDLASNDKTNDWYPSYNIVVRNNRFERTDGNGMVLRIADGPLVEYNTFYKCGFQTTGNASYPYNCDNALWQFNEASFTVYNSDDVDASGFDSDYFCKNTIIQYNYSHDNDWGSVLVCSNGSIDRAFHDGTTIRYNIFQNDGHHVVRTSGSITNTYIYNNVFYIGEDNDELVILWHKNWGGYSNKTYYYNNIIYVNANNTSYDLGSSTNNFFSNNLFYGISSSNTPYDAAKVTSDPLLVNPGSGEFGFNTLNGYKILDESPAIGAGKKILSESITDFFGNEVSPSKSITIGVHQLSPLFETVDNSSYDNNISIFPNPVTSNTTLNIESDYIGIVLVQINSLEGKLVRELKFNKNSRLVSRNLNLEGLDKGVFVISIITEDSIQSRNIIKLQ